MKPTAQYDDRPGDPSRDFAGRDGFSLYALERLVNSCGEQPDWRPRADLAAAYYDGKQLTSLQEQMIRAEGLEKRAINLVRPIINSVLGEEAKSRTDIKLDADEDEYQDVSDALSVRLKEAERETMAHMAVSNAYASGTKTGVGWAFVTRNADPLAYPYRVEEIHRNEIWWDWDAQRGVTVDDCRWLVRKRWIDLDEVMAAMPEHRRVLQATADGWDNLIAEGAFLGEPDDKLQLMEAHEAQRRFQVYRRDWIDSARKMVKLYEVWYRVPAIAVMLTLPGSLRAIEYDERDQRHREAVARGIAKVSKGLTTQVRMALYAGPHRLKDIGTRRRTFPYVPFFAFRDDEDKSPYGLIEGMIAPQDEYNERRHRIQWMLKARQLYVDDDALSTKHNTFDDLAASIMRPDLAIVTSSTRRNANAIKVVNELSMQPEQFNVMQDSKQLMQDTAGRYASQLGNAQVQSGVANSLLIEQGQQSMGEMNDNYAFFRRRVFEELVDLIKDDMLAPGLRVKVGTGATRRVIVLNAWDQSGMPVNQVKDADIKVGTTEVPASPAFRVQQQNNIATIISALAKVSPQAAAVMVPAYIESSALTDRQQIADDLRRATGMPSPADRAGRQQAEQQQMQQQQRQQQMQDGLAQAEIATRQGQAIKSQAEARRASAEAIEAEQRVAAGAAEREAQAGVVNTITAAQLNAARAQQVRAQSEREAQPAVDIDQLIADAMAEALAA